jgi:hypothetical protein
MALSDGTSLDMPSLLCEGEQRRLRKLSGWPEVLLVTGGGGPSNEVASRVAGAFHSHRPDEAAASMRPSSVYANLSCPAGCPWEVTGPLYGPIASGSAWS